MTGRHGNELTRSEERFQRFCSANSIKCERLMPDHCKTPDFRITVRGTHVYVEVKEISANNDDEKAIHDFETRGWAAWGYKKQNTRVPRKLGDRIRDKIFAATEQLERFASATAPSRSEVSTPKKSRQRCTETNEWRFTSPPIRINR